MNDSSRPIQPRRRGGFTLIELLVAISILAIVAVLGWRGLDSIVRARQTLTGQLEQTRGMQLAFAQMQSDCEHLADQNLMRGHDRLAVDNDRFTLVRTSAGESEAVQMQVVTYRLSGGVLTRRESASTRDLAQIDGLWQAALSNADTETSGGGVPVELQRGLDSMTMRSWDGSAWRVLSGTNTLPVGVTGFEVALQISGQAAGLVKVFFLGAV
ncbi:PulJ/GspJ family protein [Janthinobacterium agaricidamnosum]|uniref:Prepilin-type N-terminal cleavage/methylation domain protein n=1 Tax=Janthinobacterium agaricidamnosum NBRC 102515 = DSM 9628 TaxID=1349767 RepID=W0VA11_9BURK|nr:prepilin-type N-terminal cleavage/methylation domain-containing protein [Janthinobacterium agaricidamnosum]CDG85659.1 prepilin-type N-terminal cleavage/methylation domain protein [Janthinobacterium agaricidamnosum NBRC 102515 = DSM 9628]